MKSFRSILIYACFSLHLFTAVSVLHAYLRTIFFSLQKYEAESILNKANMFLLRNETAPLFVVNFTIQSSFVTNRAAEQRR